MQVLGYSERGVLSSLFHEIRYDKNGDALLDGLIDLAVFPFTDKKPSCGMASVFIEHSLSDFGDPDVVIQSEKENCAIFVEAKVAAQKAWRGLDKEFDKFEKGVRENSRVPNFSSNIFTQIYHKQQFLKHSISEIKRGVVFPQWSSKEIRKIGNNPVVINFAGGIKAHCDEAFYLLLVPDGDNQVKEFFRGKLQNSHLPCELEKSRIGYLTWASVENFCRKNNLLDTCATFEHNGDQIYHRK